MNLTPIEQLEKLVEAREDAKMGECFVREYPDCLPLIKYDGDELQEIATREVADFIACAGNTDFPAILAHMKEQAAEIERLTQEVRQKNTTITRLCHEKAAANIAHRTIERLHVDIASMAAERDTLREQVRKMEGASVGVGKIAAERERQVSAEGWTPEHDDTHKNDELANAAACYAMSHKSRRWKTIRDGMPLGTDDYSRDDGMARVPAIWPWDAEWWKPLPNDRIHELVKAGALIAAEIDRLDREAALAALRKERE